MLGQPSTINPAYLGNRMKRLVAFCIDIFPITFIIILVYRQFFEYDILLDEFLLDYDNPEIRAPFMKVQNQISMISLVVYIFYAFALEASTFQATYGKKLMGLKVVRFDGKALTPKDALWRNLFKIVSQMVLNMGFLWILFDRHKRGWHDLIGKTLIIEKEYESVFADHQGLTTKKEYVQIIKEPIELRSISEGNQSNLLFSPTISIKDFENLSSLISDPQIKFDQFFKVLIKDTDEANSNISEDVLWNNSTRGQKTFRVLHAFRTKINAGTLKQFLKTYPEYVVAMSEALNEIKASKAMDWYDKIIKGLTIDTKNGLRSATEEDLSNPEMWEQHIDAHLTEDKYSFLDEKQLQNLYSQACDFIESHQEQFI